MTSCEALRKWWAAIWSPEKRQTQSGSSIFFLSLKKTLYLGRPILSREIPKLNQDPSFFAFQGTPRLNTLPDSAKILPSVKSNSFVTLELSMTVRLRLQVHFWIRISLVTPSFWHIVLIILTQYTHVSKLMSFLDIGQLILPCAENCSTNATQIHISWVASPLCPYWPTFYLLSILANFSFPLFARTPNWKKAPCPYWPSSHLSLSQ